MNFKEEKAGDRIKTRADGDEYKYQPKYLAKKNKKKRKNNKQVETIKIDELCAKEAELSIDRPRNRIEDRPYLTCFGEIETNGARFRRFMRIPNELFAGIIRSKFSIQDNTGSEIYVPRRGEKGDVLVMGRSGEDVRECSEKVFKLARGLRFNRRVNYIIKMEMDKSTIQDDLVQFRQRMRRICGGIPDDWFCSVEDVELCRLILIRDEVERVHDLFDWFIDFLNAQIPRERPVQVGLNGFEVWKLKTPYSVSVKMTNDFNSTKVTNLIRALYQPLSAWGVCFGPRFWNPKLTLVRPPGFERGITKTEVIERKQLEADIFRGIPDNLDGLMEGVRFSDIKIKTIKLINLETLAAEIDLNLI